jgi:hypothetical protein
MYDMFVLLRMLAAYDAVSENYNTTSFDYQLECRIKSCIDAWCDAWRWEAMAEEMAGRRSLAPMTHRLVFSEYNASQECLADEREMLKEELE